MRRLKRKLEKWLLRNVLHAVSEENLLQNLSKEQVINLQLQAKDYLSKDSLFNILTSNADDLSKGKMWRHGETNEDLRFGRIMLYDTDVMRKVVSLLADKLPAQAQRVGRDKA